VVAYSCEKSNPRGSPFLAILTTRPRRNHVLTQITATYARVARRRAPECPAFHRTAQPRRQSRVRGINSLKRCGRVSDENRYQAMRALGEDPQEFENLKRELMSALTPGDAVNP